MGVMRLTDSLPWKTFFSFIIPSYGIRQTHLERLFQVQNRQACQLIINLAHNLATLLFDFHLENSLLFFLLLVFESESSFAIRNCILFKQVQGKGSDF